MARRTYVNITARTLIPLMMGLQACTIKFNASVKTTDTSTTSSTSTDSSTGSGDTSIQLGDMSVVELWDPLASDTNKISNFHAAAFPIKGSCTSGATVYVMDSDTSTVLGSGECTSSEFSLTADLSTYAEGAVSLKLIQTSGTNASSAYTSLDLTKETTYCSNSSNRLVTPNGAGTVGDPYLICTAEQLESVFIAANKAKFFHLKDDLDLSTEPTLKGRLGGADTFVGTLDGNYFGLYNYSGNQPLILEAGGAAVIQNIKMRDFNMTITSGTYWAAFFGVFSGTTFNNVSATGTASAYNFATYGGSGVLIGSIRSSISNVWVRANITYASQTVGHGAGHIVGGMDGGTNITNCKAYGTITGSGGSLFGAGVVGLVQGSWSTSANAISNCYSYVNISGSKYAGGIVGNARPGTSLSISNAHYEGTLAGDHGTGGIIGSTLLSTNPSYIDASSAIGNFSQPSNCIGGIVGYLVNASTINRSFFRGTLTATAGTGAGGIVGCAATSVALTDVYAIADVTGNSDVAGIIGSGTSSEITSSFFKGTISSGEDALTNDVAAPTVTDTYYSSNSSTSSYGTGLANSLFTDQASFSGFTFDSTHWVMGTEYPNLYFE